MMFKFPKKNECNAKIVLCSLLIFLLYKMNIRLTNVIEITMNSSVTSPASLLKQFILNVIYLSIFDNNCSEYFA